MKRVGIEDINVYCGSASLDVRSLFEARQLDLSRFENLMMDKKSVGLPCEDPVTNAVNAAKPLIDGLSQSERDSIEMVITCSESGIDFGKSLSTYVHHYLGLHKHCRLFEVKQACYAATAALHMAFAHVASQVSPGSRVLVIATDEAKAVDRLSYAEPSQGIAGVAMLVGEQPDIFAVDLGASGKYSFEVMDTCRPQANMETGNPDISLLSYLDCLQFAYQQYQDKVEGADLIDSFNYLAFHTPFAGMVKGAHRKLLRSIKKLKPGAIEQDFQQRMMASLKYGQQVGNVYSAALYLALVSLIDNTDIQGPCRIGLFSYGSGCSSEFFSGVITAKSKAKLVGRSVGAALASRYVLSIDEYEQILKEGIKWGFGIQQQSTDTSTYQRVFDQQFKGQNKLYLKHVEDFHRQYEFS